MPKLTVNLPSEEVEALRALAAKRQVTLTCALRQAIASEKLLDDIVRDGGTVLIEGDGRTRQLILK